MWHSCRRCPLFWLTPRLSKVLSTHRWLLRVSMLEISTLLAILFPRLHPFLCKPGRKIMIRMDKYSRKAVVSSSPFDWYWIVDAFSASFRGLNFAFENMRSMRAGCVVYCNVRATVLSVVIIVCSFFRHGPSCVSESSLVMLGDLEH